MRHLDARYLDAFRTMNGSSLQLIWHVLIPAALPSAMTALKVSSGTAVAVLFMAESFATQSGLGFLIMDAWGRGDQLEMFCGILPYNRKDGLPLETPGKQALTISSYFLSLTPPTGE